MINSSSVAISIGIWWLIGSALHIGLFKIKGDSITLTLKECIFLGWLGPVVLLFYLWFLAKYKIEHINK